MLKFALFLAVIGCGNLFQDVNDVIVTPVYDEKYIDPRVADEYNAFLERCSRSKYASVCYKNKEKLISIRIVNKLQNKKPDVIGTCYLGRVLRTIELKASAMEGAHFQVKSLIQHELQHCLADMPHKNGRHIMAPAQVIIKDQEDWDRLEAEMWE